MKRLPLIPALLLVLLVALPGLAAAQATVPALTATPGPDGSQTWSFNIETLVFMTMLSFLPAMLLMMTGFTRIIIVLSLLRTAMGTNTAPPNSVLIGLALFLTFYAMSPVFDQVYELAYQPLSAGTINFQQALELGAVAADAERIRERKSHLSAVLVGQVRGLEHGLLGARRVLRSARAR